MRANNSLKYPNNHMNHLKNFILDMDGVLWHGETAVPGLRFFFDTLQELKINFVLATNNASKTPEQYVEKLHSFGVEVALEQVLTSAIVTASYLQQTYATDTAVYVLGGNGLHEAVRQQGFSILTTADVFERGLRADVVVVGLSREATYNDFAAATICINEGAAFVGTNPDVTFTSEHGPLPGAGAFLALVQAATAVEPITIGKPGQVIFEQAIKRVGGAPENTVMVGDRLDTDIAGGNMAGLNTILVLSGITTPDAFEENGPIKPTYVFANIQAIAEALRESHQA